MQSENTSRSSFLGWLNAVLLLCLTVVCFLNHQNLNKLVNSDQPGESERIDLLSQMASERRGLQSEIEKLRKQLNSAESALGKDEQANQHLISSYRQAQAQAGLSPVSGPGIAIRLADSEQPVPPEADPYYFIVHDASLQALVNELWATGAEAIAINGHRLVYRSSIRCIGPTVLVNNQRLTSPYLVQAIGPEQEMAQGLRLPGGFMTYMSPFLGNGVSVSIDKTSSIQLPGFRGELSFEFAQTADDTTTSQEDQK